MGILWRTETYFPKWSHGFKHWLFILCYLTFFSPSDSVDTNKISVTIIVLTDQLENNACKQKVNMKSFSVSSLTYGQVDPFGFWLCGVVYAVYTKYSYITVYIKSCVLTYVHREMVNSIGFVYVLVYLKWGRPRKQPQGITFTLAKTIERIAFRGFSTNHIPRRNAHQMAPHWRTDVTFVTASLLSKGCYTKK